MSEFIARMFTPSDSDQQSGAQFNQAAMAASQAAEARRPAEIKQELRAANRPKKKTVTKFGGAANQTPILESDQADLAKKILLGQ